MPVRSTGRDGAVRALEVLSETSALIGSASGGRVTRDLDRLTAPGAHDTVAAPRRET
jgi:hypothetical protein